MNVKLPKWLQNWLTNKLTPKVGVVVPPPAALALEERTLLYFKAKGCVVCGDIDAFVARIAAGSGLALRVIDASPSIPTSLYGGKLLYDKGGALRRAYGVRGFPTFIVTSPSGYVEHAVLGGEAEEAAMEKRLGLSKAL